jgi:hypothetical protein
MASHRGEACLCPSLTTCSSKAPFSTTYRIWACLYQDLASFGKALLESMQPSVDAFLESRTSTSRSEGSNRPQLIPCERPEALVRTSDSVGWYMSLFNQIGSTEPTSDSKLGVITFNYDRSFEYSMYTAIANVLGLGTRTPMELHPEHQ